MVKVSIIVPVYNIALYVERCFISLSNQSYSNIEIIFVNDGSTDNSASLLSIFEQQDNRVVVKTICNSGVTIARRKGLAMATGDYVIFVDGDDCLTDNCIEILINNALRYDLDISIGLITQIINKQYINNKNYISGLLDNKQYISALLSQKIDWGPCVKLMKKSIFDCVNAFDIDDEFKRGEDLIMNLILAKNTNKIYVENQYLYQYFRNPSSVCSTFNTSLNYETRFINKVLDVSKDLNYYSEDLHYFCQKVLLNFISVSDEDYSLSKVFKKIGDTPFDHSRFSFYHQCLWRFKNYKNVLMLVRKIKRYILQQ